MLGNALCLDSMLEESDERASDDDFNVTKNANLSETRPGFVARTPRRSDAVSAYRIGLIPLRTDKGSRGLR